MKAVSYLVFMSEEWKHCTGITEDVAVKYTLDEDQMRNINSLTNHIAVLVTL